MWSLDPKSYTQVVPCSGPRWHRHLDGYILFVWLCCSDTLLPTGSCSVINYKHPEAVCVCACVRLSICLCLEGIYQGACYSHDKGIKSQPSSGVRLAVSFEIVSGYLLWGISWDWVVAEVAVLTHTRRFRCLPFLSPPSGRLKPTILEGGSFQNDSNVHRTPVATRSVIKIYHSNCQDYQC
jgi:hypothetical protein